MNVHIIKWGKAGSIRSVHDNYVDACIIAEKENEKIPRWQKKLDKLFAGSKIGWGVQTFTVREKSDE